MVRKIMMLLIGVLAMCSLAGCGGSDSQEIIQPDVYTLSGKLTDGIKFEDSVEEVSLDRALKYYGIDSGMVNAGEVLMSTGATAEELAVFEAASTSSASVILEKLTAHSLIGSRCILTANPLRLSDLTMRYCMHTVIL